MTIAHPDTVISYEPADDPSRLPRTINATGTLRPRRPASRTSMADACFRVHRPRLDVALW